MMVGVTDIVLALVVGYVLWVVVPVLWRYSILYRLAMNVTSRELPCHWFWGHMNMLDESVSLIEQVAKGMESNRAKMSALWLSWVPLIQASHPDTAQVILKLSEPKPKGRGQPYSVFETFMGDGLVVSNGRKWERNRKLLTPAFHFEVLRPYVRIYNEATDKLLDKFAKQMKDNPKSIEVTDALNLATLDVILRCSLSHEGNIQDSDEHPYATAVHRIGILTTARFRIPWYFLFWTLYAMSANGKEYIKHVKYIHGFAEEIIAKRKQALAEDPSLLKTKKKLDFLDILMTAKDENGAGLTDEEMRDEVDTFMFAGHDTTLGALSWAIYNLGKYPEEQEKLFREVCDVTGDRKYIEWEDIGKLHKVTMFLKENLRMYSPAGNTTRLLTKPLELDGQIYPAGVSLGVNIMPIHLRPDIYPEPMEFRPERFLPENTEHRHPYAFIPFSAGPRNCIGKNFSMDEQRVIIARIVKRFKVVLDEDHEVRAVARFILSPHNGIRVRLEER